MVLKVLYNGNGYPFFTNKFQISILFSLLLNASTCLASSSPNSKCKNSHQSQKQIHSVDLVTFTEETLNENFIFCAVYA